MIIYMLLLCLFYFKIFYCILFIGYFIHCGYEVWGYLAICAVDVLEHRLIVLFEDCRIGI
jgi:hypothetical protein